MNDNAPTPAPSPGHPTAPFVTAMIAVSILLFLLAVGMIAFNWMRTSEPSSELMLVGSSSLAGAEASVRSVDEKEPFKSTFGSGGRFTLPFYLGPGSFIVRITKDGELIDEREVIIRANERIMVDLSQWEQKLATSLATSQPVVTPPSTSMSDPLNP
jgi:hypothetical protein